MKNSEIDPIKRSPIVVQLLFYVSVIGILFIFLSPVADGVALKKMTPEDIYLYVPSTEFVFKDDSYKVKFDLDEESNPTHIYIYTKNAMHANFWFFDCDIPYTGKYHYYADDANKHSIHRKIPKNKKNHR
jgi:hypothetical protein